MSIATKDVLVAYLKQLSVGVLSTISPDTTPYGSVIYFTVDDDLHFYFATAPNSRKDKNLQANPHAALTTVDLSAMTTVQTTGIVEKVEDEEKCRHIHEELLTINEEKNQSGSPPPIAQLDMQGAIPVFKFTPNWLRVGEYSGGESFGTSKKNNIFYEPIPKKE